MNTVIYSINIMLPVFIILSFLKAIDFIYLFQIKEYRFDRFISFLEEEGIVQIFYTRKPRMPGKSLRNILLLFISLFILLLFPIDILSGFVGLVILLIFIPPITFISVCIGIWITGILASIQRNSKIDKAKELIQHSNTVFIGITGSYGKSSVKEFVYAILSTQFKTAKTDENMNTDVGVAISILKNLKPDTQYFIAEMGAYKIGEIKKICDYVHPKIGILTAIGNQHLDLFGSKENLERAKSELFASLPTDGNAYMNLNIENKDFFKSHASCPVTHYSLNQNADISAHNVIQSKDGISADISYGKHSFTIQTQLVGIHTIENLLPAIGLGIDLGIPVEKIKQAAQELKNIEAKLSLHKGINGSTILNDAKNSSVDGFIAAIKTASSFPNKKKYIISKGIIELGHAKGESYKRIVDALNDVNITLLTTDKLFLKFQATTNIQHFYSEDEIITAIKSGIDADTLILLEGRFTKRFVNTFI